MSCVPSPDQFEDATSAAFALARSDWLNAFSDLEVAILRCANWIGLTQDAKRTPLSIRLAALRDSPASPRLPKTHARTLNDLSSACERLLTLRAAIVHSRMRFGTSEGIPAAFFQNALDAAVDQPVFTILTLEQMERMRGELAELTRGFQAISISPSGPPRPSPA